MGSPSNKQDHFAYIDALRGYAIIGVIIVHTGQVVAGMGDVTAWGARGVQFFFVVSALTLAASWDSRADGAAPFLVRRVFRIAPMFWLAIAWYGMGGTPVGTSLHRSHCCTACTR